MHNGVSGLTTDSPDASWATLGSHVYLFYLAHGRVCLLCDLANPLGYAIRTRRLSKIRRADYDVRAVGGREDVDNVGRPRVRCGARDCATSNSRHLPDYRKHRTPLGCRRALDAPSV